MNEIEKMYELANVQPQYKKQIECKEGHTIGQPCGKCPCIDCDKSVFEDIMSPFTAEKQLELIKLLSERELYINHAEGEYFIFTTNIGGSKCSKDFDTSLAEYINFIWQDLTEDERKQIRDILEG